MNQDIEMVESANIFYGLARSKGLEIMKDGTPPGIDEIQYKV